MRDDAPLSQRADPAETATDPTDADTTGRPGRAAAVVVGGGLAGITSALALADAGLRVTLLEGRPRLGGLAFSFQRGNLSVDNGQHVYLRCCTAYQWFLDRIAATDLAPLQRRLDVPVLDVAASRGPRLGRLRRTALPVPLHLAQSLTTYPHLSLAERAKVGRAALALGRLDLTDPALDRQDFASWLARQGQSARAIEALWDLVGVATLNARAGDASLGLAAMVFKTGLLSAPGAADIGWAQVPLGDIHDTLARKALDAAGVRTELRTRVTSVARTPDSAPGSRSGNSLMKNGHWTVEVPGERIETDIVVLAVPQREAHALLPSGAVADPDRFLRIDTAPILNVHVQYDRTVLKRPFFAVLGSPVQWVFDRTRASGLTDGQYLALSQSAAQDEIDEPVAKLRARYLPELEKLLPAARDARVRDFFVTRERTATFAPTPGVGALRPGARTEAPGLYLAGAWTATGWPATMEGAVRSGTSAARAALTALGRPGGHLFEEAA
ncbi:hydroxysqualene dehydroxylase HpnE [Streptomyces odontomachi]|uniref:hydroxysqualene dehydroxylase HpnE n=1 Tax=Streptomyces odontomachi TaxID=2944940 RepID=UPI00210A7C81|nr:hydroxysqualene dehydroxylase HpnE [Streptomyces sp. ODS25]